ncbi:MAG: hypothetical protein PHR82_07855 [Endomicrobiaceae bacterium]|jgi:hypothetical protein|nr:hypothetical protein [Endomicrobiaceae bacterium]
MKNKKVLGTDVSIGGRMLDYIRERGYTGTHNQFRIICKCTSLYDANKKCSAAGLGDKVFVQRYTSETGNKIELELAEKEDIWIGTDKYHGNVWISASELRDIGG